MLNGGQSTQQAPASPAPTQQASTETGVPKDQIGQFIAAILAETEDVWSQVLPAQKGIQYVPPKLVLYNGFTRSGCGGASASMGPFYCPEDKKVYLDTSFFRDMQTKYGGGGDFAYAYVIAHEIGHHVQDQLGILSKVNAAEQNADDQTQGQRALRADRIDGPIVSPASGPTTRRRNITSSIRATSRRRWRLLRLSATTGCRKRRGAMPCRIHSRTGQRRSAYNGWR